MPAGSSPHPPTHPPTHLGAGAHLRIHGPLGNDVLRGGPRLGAGAGALAVHLGARVAGQALVEVRHLGAALSGAHVGDDAGAGAGHVGVGGQQAARGLGGLGRGQRDVGVGVCGRAEGRRGSGVRRAGGRRRKAAGGSVALQGLQGLQRLPPGWAPSACRTSANRLPEGSWEASSRSGGHCAALACATRARHAARAITQRDLIEGGRCGSCESCKPRQTRCLEEGGRVETRGLMLA